MSKILITGASGFVGGFLVEKCLDLNPALEVYAGVRKTSSREYLQDPRIKFFEVDFTNPKKLEAALEAAKFDYVIHNAGLTKTDKVEDFFRVNTQYTGHFIDALSNISHPPKKFTFISSLAAYGPADNKAGDTILLDEPPLPIDSYGESKMQAEHLVRDSKLPYLIFRPTAVYGPREKDILTFFKILNTGLEAYIGFQEQTLTFIHVEDLAKVVTQATLSEVENKAYFVSDGKNYKNDLLGTYSKAALHRKTFKIRIPVGIVKMIARINEMVGNITGKMPALNLEKVKILTVGSWACETQPLIDDFDFKPKYDLESGLEQTMHWYKANKWL